MKSTISDPSSEPPCRRRRESLYRYDIEYTFDHSGIDKDRITLRNYFGGHMMYLHDPSLEALVSDIGAFIENR
jgi:carboxypeptidase C (cathepsin A)